MPDEQNNVQKKPSWFLILFASGLYSGYVPIASGTAGAAVGLLLYLLPGFEQPVIILPITLLTVFLGIRYCGRLESYYGQDPSQVTIDEVAGMWISLLFLPKTLPVIIIAFFLFRILDILKPSPARFFDQQKGGLGIMMDDVISGLYTNLTLQLLVALKIIQS